MNLDDLRFLRDKLGLPAKTFAAVFGVATSTLYRWENHAALDTLRMDPFRVQLFTVLRARLLESSLQETHDLSEEVNKAFVRSGSLFALSKVLDFIYAKERV